MKICSRCLARTSEPLERCPADEARLLDLGEGDDPVVGTVAGGRAGAPSSGFLVLDRVASGGMGTVYRAYQASMDRDVALKVLSGPELRDPELVERFRREAVSCARLRSPHTIVVYERGELEGGALFIAMELLSGRSLGQIIEAEAPLDPARLVDLASQLCSSLAEAHALGIIHRDVKPSNIMVETTHGGREHVKVLDFGLVKMLEREEGELSLTSAGGFCGTPPYMAPELWSNEYGSTGPAADVYSAGVVLYQMLSGRHPFVGKTAAALMHKHLYEEPAPLPPEVLENHAGAEIAKIIARCLKKRAADRFASAHDLHLALAGVTPSGSILERAAAPASRGSVIQTAEQETRVPRAVTDRAPRFARGLLAAGALAAIGVVTVVGLWPRGEQQRMSLSGPVNAPADVDPDVTSAGAAAPGAVVQGVSARSPTTSAERAGAVEDRAPRSLRTPAVPPKPAGVHVSEVRVIGGLAADEAERSLRSIEAELARCYRRSSAGASAALRIHFVLAPEGRILSVKVGPEAEPGAEEMRECVVRSPKQPVFAAFGGSRFSTVSARVGP